MTRRAAPDAVPAVGRLEILDSLRGFALFGILVVNIAFFASAYPLRELDDPAFTSTLDDVVRYVVAVVFESKFYLLFSFLFGYSFTLQIEAAERRGASFVPGYLRRLLGLALIGVAHAVLLWQGDILTTYALMGLVLLMLRGLAPRRAFSAGIAVLLVTALFFVLAGLDELSQASGSHGVDHDALADAFGAQAAYRGGPGEVLSQRIAELPEAAGFILLLQAPSALAMFLIGLAAGKRRVLADVERYRAALVRTVRVGLPVGLAGAVVYAYTSIEHGSSGWALIGLAVDVLTAPLLTASYVASFVLVVQGQRARRVAGAIAPMGRMALSNYIVQSVLCGLVFTGYGLGLVGELGPASVLLIAAGIYALQIPLSAWWLGGHVYGPLEWVLRALTYWRPPAWSSLTPRAMRIDTKS